MKLRKRRGRPARMEMIPLMDCIFLLLVVFVYSMMSMTVHQGIRVELPAAATADQNRLDYFSVTIDSRGEVFAGLDAVSIAELTRRVAAARERNEASRVYVNADRGVSHGKVVEVLDGIRAGGITAVSIATEGDR